jgi:hypothetical protein
MLTQRTFDISLKWHDMLRSVCNINAEALALALV